MKQIIKFLVVTLLFFSQARAQDSIKKLNLGIDLAFGKPSVFKNGFFPALTFSWDKQVVFAGPTQVIYDDEHTRPLNGMQVGYRIFPNGRNKKFNLFFEYNLNFVKGKLQDRISYHVYEIPIGSGTRTTHLVSLDNYFGFGFRWNMTKRLYMASNIGFGLGFYKEDYTYTYPNGETWEGKGDLALRDPFFNFNRIFKIGVGYDLIHLKTKK